MIYTVTLNPSIDHVLKISDFKEGLVNKVDSENFFAGGKGINVSKILKEHNLENIALGFISGFTGSFIKNDLDSCEIKNDFINVLNGCCRINTKLKTLKNETEINGIGPSISNSNAQELFSKLRKLSENDILILAGSIPPSLPEDFYEQILKHLQGKNIKVIVDARNNLLLNVLKYKPFLIKPNHLEISEIFNVELKETKDLIFYGNKLKEMGAKNVLISLGKDGAILLTEKNEIFKSNIPKGELKNSVGAGDSMVGGFIAGYLKNECFEEALKLGAATGSATAYSDDLAKKSFIYELLNQIEVSKIQGGK